MNPSARTPLIAALALVVGTSSLAGAQAASLARQAPLLNASAIAMPPLGGSSDSQATSLNWPVLGFEPGLSGYNPHETILSPANVPNLAQTWTSATGEPVALIEDNGLVFVQSSRASTDYVTAVRTSDGTQAWTTLINNWSYTPGLAAGSGLVFSVCASSSGVAALCAFHESTGKLKWSISFDCHCLPNGSVFQPPVYDKGAVFFQYSAGGGNHVYFAAVGARNGNVLWTAPINYALYFPSPAVAKGIVYASCSGSNFNGLCALSASNGTVLWSYSSGSNVYTGGGQSVANGVVYFVEDLSSGSYGYEQTLTALNATTGAPLWTFTRPDNANGFYSSQPASPKAASTGSPPMRRCTP